ncbi:MAG: hypothetical protein IPJ03_01160 [Ignavibacteriales bacterium]|nr:hypothetical protein [Ignavibacteriales bacterium]
MTNIITETGTALTSLNKYLTDPQINSDLKNSLSNLNSLLVDVKKVLNENDQNISKLMQNSVELTEEAKSFITQNKDGITSSLTDLKTLLAKKVIRWFLNSIELLMRQPLNKIIWVKCFTMRSC